MFEGLLKAALMVMLAHQAAHAVVQLTADVRRISTTNGTMAIFRCTADQNQMYFLNHVLTWSKIGRDGRERYLSINWDLVQHGKDGKYAITSNTITEPTAQKSQGKAKMYFVLGKTALHPTDHGEYICRLFDFDRNLLAEEHIPVSIFDNGLYLSPYKIESDSGQDVAISCMFNTSGTSDAKIVLKHIRSDGVSRKLEYHGELFEQQRTPEKYNITQTTFSDGLQQNVLTIKAPNVSDQGFILCELENKSQVISSTKASFTVDAVKLKVTPRYFLNVPMDSVAHFKCACDIIDIERCKNNEFAWAIVKFDKSGKQYIYKNGQLLNNNDTDYEITKGDNGSSVNLTIHGIKIKENEGDFVCFLYNSSTGKEIAHASIPVSVIPLSLVALSLTDNYPSVIRFLCTLSGSLWDANYFDDHKMVWSRVKDRNETKIASNAVLERSLDPLKYQLQFSSQRYYSILDIKDVVENDYGDYRCKLINIHSGKVILQKILGMYGQGNITMFAN